MYYRMSDAPHKFMFFYQKSQKGSDENIVYYIFLIRTLAIRKYSADT